MGDIEAAAGDRNDEVRVRHNKSDRRKEGQSTHEIVSELRTIVQGHIDAEPKVMQDAVESAVRKTIDMLVPDGDANGHKAYHKDIMDTIALRKRAAEEEAEFWVQLRRSMITTAAKSGVVFFFKLLAVILSLLIVFKFGPLVEKYVKILAP